MQLIPSESQHIKPKKIPTLFQIQVIQTFSTSILTALKPEHIMRKMPIKSILPSFIDLNSGSLFHHSYYLVYREKHSIEG